MWDSYSSWHRSMPTIVSFLQHISKTLTDLTKNDINHINNVVRNLILRYYTWVFYKNHDIFLHVEIGIASAIHISTWRKMKRRCSVLAGFLTITSSGGFIKLNGWISTFLCNGRYVYNGQLKRIIFWRCFSKHLQIDIRVGDSYHCFQLHTNRRDLR